MAARESSLFIVPPQRSRSNKEKRTAPATATADATVQFILDKHFDLFNEKLGALEGELLVAVRDTIQKLERTREPKPRIVR
jgi:hypothetical protein